MAENLLNLKIHKMSNESFEAAEASGTLDNSALYLTPEVDVLNDIKDGYVTKAVGGISSGSTLESQLSGEKCLEDFIKKLLGIQNGRAPYGLTIALYYADGANKDKALPNSVTAALNEAAINAYARWSLSAGTYPGEYTPSITGSNTTVPSSVSKTSATSGTISNITITLAGSHTTAKVTYTVSYNAFGEVPGNTLSANDSITIQRNCYYGPSASLATTAMTSKNNWTVTAEVSNDYFVIQYPSGWGKISSIIDNDTQYEALGSAFGANPETITKNGGSYYQYKTINKQNGKMNFTIK